MTDILSQLEEAEWTAPQGRGETPSPYLPAVEKSWAERAEGSKMGKPFAFTVTLNGANNDERSKDLTTHLNLLRKAGRQVKPEPVSVLVQTGDIVKGSCKITFTTREKITRQAATPDASATAAPAA